MLKPKSKNISSIYYLVITKEPGIIRTFIPPETFLGDQILRFICLCPEDLMQLTEPINYLDINMRLNRSNGFNVNFLYHHDIEETISFLDYPGVNMIFIDCNLTDYAEIYEVASSKLKTGYFHFFNVDNRKLPTGDNIVKSPNSLILKLVNDQESILKNLNSFQKIINPSVTIIYKNYLERHYFVPTQSNSLLMNRFVGNFFSKNYVGETEEVKLHAEESKKATEEANTFNRQKLFVNQIRKIDYFRNVSLKENITKPISESEPLLSPLILIVPFHNPDAKDGIDHDAFISFCTTEQTSNYIAMQETRNNIRAMTMGMRIMQLRLKYLDDVGALHGSFSNSPVLRTPVKGKSIYRELSFFSVESGNYSGLTSRKKIKKTISRLGNIMTEKLLSKEVQNLIKERNGQIIAISDLPIEWIEIDGIPLSFSHDVCRLPETSMHGLMALYARNNMMNYSISKDVLSKSLVIFGCSENNFLIWQKQANELAKQLGFNTRCCEKVDDVKKAIEELKPEFIVFDCHGGYNKESNSTYLMIGDEKMDGNYVVANNISAPLVFISACGTAPTYGAITTIANAFFESGAFSVTTTYLPILITSGSVLYLRVLNKLAVAAIKPIHKNWLDFISHVIRTASINETFVFAQKNDKISEEYGVANVVALTKSLFFHERRKIYSEMDSLLSALSKKDSKQFSTIIPENLFYSNLGRGDLISFDCWEEENQKQVGLPD